MTTIKDIAVLQARLIASFPNYHPADLDLTCQVWLDILGDLSSEMIKAAVLQYSSENHDFAPSAGTIRDLAMRLNASASGIPDAHQAYKEVMEMPTDMTRTKVTEEGGQYFIDKTKLTWSHELIGITAATIGWPKTFPTDNATADRAQFLKAYESELSRFMTDAARLPAVKAYIEQASKQTRLLPVDNLVKKLESPK